MIAGTLSGLATGALLGLLGGGGSIIAVPLLVYLLGLAPKAAVGTSLIIVGIASLLAAWSHYRKDTVVISTALTFGACGGLGSFTGAQIARHIPDAIQMTMFAVVMAVVALLMLRHKTPPLEDGSKEKKAVLPLILAAGFAAGTLTGILGVGGGFIIVPVLTMLVRMPIRNAIGTSLLIIGINSLIGALSYASQFRLNYAVLPFALSTLTAAAVAGRLAHHIPQGRLKTFFALSLLVLSAWMLSRQIFP
ncbi:MAG: sulfite exporter TauE/SafE family protein [Cyanobacteria bacterium SZAS LIN-3]|nr:sulfite exporter TauE/SafE family protein [Cyanobacteria bacterium SZAS LIN-3]